MRLHSCYFSMQNFETTVADQGAVGMLFKGPLLFWGNAIKACIDYTRYSFVMSNGTLITPPRATARVPTPLHTAYKYRFLTVGAGTYPRSTFLSFATLL